ncbi:MAG: TraR/DksA C4-type zinc finger protein [Microthrixaceae bacterium]
MERSPNRAPWLWRVAEDGGAVVNTQSDPIDDEMVGSIDPAAVRASLEALRAELLDSAPDIDAEVFRTRSDVSDGSGETEHLVVAEQKDMTARVDALTERAVAEIDDALARLDAGTYGRCTDCGRAIPAERLEAVPAAATCMDCAATRSRGRGLV